MPTQQPPRSARLITAIVLIAALATAVSWWVLENRNTWPRGQALADALTPVTLETDTDRALVAQTILTNYREVRANAKRWSGIYWGCTFVAALFSALAGLVLKLESLPLGEKAKKDIAAVLAVSAAILVTISTSGDFQRKWQANRIAAAELEQAGYSFLADPAGAPRPYLNVVARILHQRHLAIVGLTEEGSLPLRRPEDPLGKPDG